MKTPEEIKKGLECLDKMQFFMGQRAGRELWMDKPHDVQERDIEDYNRDIETVRSCILQLERERDAAVNNLHGMCGACIRHNNDDDEIYVCSKYVECVHGIGDDEGEDYWQWRGVWEVE